MKEKCRIKCQKKIKFTIPHSKEKKPNSAKHRANKMFKFSMPKILYLIAV